MKGYVVVPHEVINKLNLPALGIVMALKGQGLEQFTYSQAKNIRRGITSDEFEEAFSEIQNAGLVTPDDEREMDTIYAFTF